MRQIILISSIFISSLLANNYSTSSEWLLETNSTAEKFKKIETQFRGFDLAMVEVGYRFNSFYFALKDKNYPLANYQWDKIKKSIDNGTMRRPKRKSNSQNMFLDTTFKSMQEALAKKDEKLIWQEYNKTKVSCNACHVAENVPFINVIDPVVRWQSIQ